MTKTKSELLDQFAIAAMQALMQRGDWNHWKNGQGQTYTSGSRGLTELAYTIAKAMLDERAKHQ